MPQPPVFTHVRPLRRLLPALLAAVLLPVAGGCLTSEYKEYRIKLRADRSGDATIRFVNILSESDDSTAASEDFEELVNGYLLGTKIEKGNPSFHNVKKRLYEQDGVLVGEVSFSFDSLAVVRLFKYDAGSPIMFFLGDRRTSELLVETNGTYGRDWMPVVFWPAGATELTLRTRIAPQALQRRSLLRDYREWQTAQSRPRKQ